MSLPVTYRLATTPEEFARAAETLAAGRGAFAVDTERASAFRYDDRAFLVQIYRRDAGTFLFAPEGHRSALTDALAPVVNGTDWILHAASDDLKSLAHLGLYPGTLFDTELASRLAGFDRPNLGAMVQHFVGVELEKGHGHEDWSTTPLPASWQEYAALDVVHLHALAEALAEFLDEHGKLSFAEQEFAHVVAEAEAATYSPRKTWRDVKGVSALRNPSSLQIARGLWEVRDRIGRSDDLAPGKVLANDALVAIAKEQPRTVAELRRVARSRSMSRQDAREWLSHVEAALAEDSSTWPSPTQKVESDQPSKSTWEREYPRSYRALQLAREAVAGAAADLDMLPEVLLQPRALREAMWFAPDDGARWSANAAADRLNDAGARPWQIDATASLLSRAQEQAALEGVPARRPEASGRAAARRRRKARG